MSSLKFRDKNTDTFNLYYTVKRQLIRNPRGEKLKIKEGQLGSKILSLLLQLKVPCKSQKNWVFIPHYLLLLSSTAFPLSFELKKSKQKFGGKMR